MKMEQTFLCVHCGGRYRMPMLVSVNGEELCRDCAETETVICSDCGTRIWRDDNVGNAELPLCGTCYEQRYTNCVRCARPIPLSCAVYEPGDAEERYPYCSDCFQHRGEGVRDYS